MPLGAWRAGGPQRPDHLHRRTLRRPSFLGFSLGPERASVTERLVDGYSTGVYAPDNLLSRGELAQYLVLAGSLRQSLPFPGKPSASGLDPKKSPLVYACAETVASRGAVLRDLTYSQSPVMLRQGGEFNPNGRVSRLDLAYSLVQSLAMEPQATALAGTSLTAFYDGKRVPVEDSASVPSSLRGYVQLALDTGMLVPRFALKDSTVFGAPPTLIAYFDAGKWVTRADYAFSAGTFNTVYRLAED